MLGTIIVCVLPVVVLLAMIVRDLRDPNGCAARDAAKRSTAPALVVTDEPERPVTRRIIDATTHAPDVRHQACIAVRLSR